MKVFLHDYYLRSFGWYAFKEAIVDGSLNLSLYFDKYINESALLNSSNKAKVFSVSLLKNYSRIEAEISKLIDSLNKLIDVMETNGQDNEKVEVLEDLKNIRNLVEDGNVFRIDSKKIDQAKKLLNKNNKKQLKKVNAIVKSIKDNLDKIEKYNVFDIFISKKIFDEYKFFEKLLDGLYNDLEIKTFKLKTKSRLVVGLGDESVYETSIRLHRNYGVPYIPGSALKGVAKHYSIMNLTERLMRLKLDEDFYKLAKRVQEALENPAKDENDEREVKKAIEAKLKIDFTDEILEEFKQLRTIFGTQRYEGSIIFFDALPTPEQLKSKPILELDIINPHYQPYYSASEKDLREKVEKAPGDWHSPNPIFFLTVPKGVEFQFAIAPRNDEACSGKPSLLDKAVAVVKDALQEHGVGAKTSLDYGRLA